MLKKSANRKAFDCRTLFYGVDINPLAVELAKLSIWLVTLADGRPFAFSITICGTEIPFRVKTIRPAHFLDLKPARTAPRNSSVQKIDKLSKSD